MEDPRPAPAGGDAAPGYPCYAGTELVAVIARPPDREVPGVRLTLRPDFDVTQEHAARREGIEVGEILDRSHRPAGPLVLPAESLNRHVFVCGATGAGKSQTVRALLEAGTRAGIPWLVVEPAKAEYRLMAARLAPPAEVVRIRPGESDAIAAGLNPLEPAPDARGPPVPAADPRRPGQSAVHRVLPLRGAVPAGAQRRPDQGLRGRRVGHGARRDDRARSESQLSEPHRPAARRDQDRPGNRLQPADHRRRAGLHQGAAVQPAAGHHRPVPRGRPSARLRRAAAHQCRARDRGRRRRQRQGVPHGHRADQAGRAPADGAPGEAGRTGHAAAPDRHRGGAPAAPPAGSPGERIGRGRGRARGRDVRWPARRDPRLRRGAHHRRADPRPPGR